MSEEAPAIGGIAALAIDCTDPPGLAHWWQCVLGGAIEVHPQGYATLYTPEGLALDFLPVPEPKTGKNRLHLDARSRDVATAVEQALALGATRADDIYAGGCGRCCAIPRATGSPHPQTSCLKHGRGPDSGRDCFRLRPLSVVYAADAHRPHRVLSGVPAVAPPPPRRAAAAGRVSGAGATAGAGLYGVARPVG